MNRTPSTLILISFVLLLAAGCSSESPTSEPTSLPEPTMPPSPRPGAITVGDLIARSDQAWPAVASMETTFWVALADDVGTPAANGSVTIERMIRPTTRQMMHVTEGNVTDEQIAIDGRIYMKGALVVAAIAPMVGPDTWVEIDSAATSDSPAAMQVAYLLQPIASPFASVSDETRALDAIPSGEVTVGARTCSNFAFGDETGQTIRYELALDENDLPCQLRQFSGDYVNVTTYDFDIPNLVITAPVVATPEPGP